MKVYRGKVSGSGTTAARFVPDRRFIEWLESVLSLPWVKGQVMEVRLMVPKRTPRAYRLRVVVIPKRS